jgi:hypothetical protein
MLTIGSIRPAGVGAATTVLVAALIGSASASTIHTDPVHRFADGSAIAARSTLSSDAGGIRHTFDTRELVTGHAYTLWGHGVVNPTGAEIHLLPRDHGAATRDTAYAMTHSFDACNGDCSFVQFSPHPQNDVS